VVPVWFVLDGDDVIFTTGRETVKGRALARTGRASLCVDDQAPPYSFVTIEATAVLSHDPEELLDWATRIGDRYMGSARAEKFGRRNAVPEEALVRLTPVRMLARAGVAD
jgi:PPOX class probable F420-dependent enzyme